MGISNKWQVNTPTNIKSMWLPTEDPNQAPEKPLYTQQPIIAPQMTPSRAALKESLAKDIAAGTQTIKETQSRLGIQPTTAPQFTEKGILS